LEIIALMKPIQLKESLVNDAIDTPKIKVTSYRLQITSMVSS